MVQPIRRDEGNCVDTEYPQIDPPPPFLLGHVQQNFFLNVDSNLVNSTESKLDQFN